MADSGIFRINPLQSWQREAILKAVQLLRDRFGSPPTDPHAGIAHDGLLEVLDPARRTERLQRELSEATRTATATETTETPERRAGDRRGAADKRKSDEGPPPGTPERRRSERRSDERRSRR